MLKEADMESGAISKRSLEIVTGNGYRIRSSEGRSYIDMGASYGVMNVGHSNPMVAKAVRDQIGKLTYVSSSYDSPPRRELMERIRKMAPFPDGKVFLCNSGTEAVEAALKFSMDLTGRNGIVSAKKGFHGRTMGALSATWSPGYRTGFEDFLGPVRFVSYGDPEGLRENISDETAAVILEPVQGEGGVNPPPSGYLKEVERICGEAGALLILDEVQTGMGRCGTPLALESEDVVPDMVLMGKSLGGGLPLGCVVFRGNGSAIKRGRHGSTFGGNPVVSAAGCAAVDYMTDEELPSKALENGQYMMDLLSRMDAPLIREVRGRGLLIGVELKRRAGKYLSRMLENGVAAIPGGSNVIRFLPPLVVDQRGIDETIEVLGDALNG